MAFLINTHTLFPEYQYSKQEVIGFYNAWIDTQDRRYQKKAQAIFDSTVSELKNTIVDAEELFSSRSLEVSNTIYCQKAIELGTRVLEESLEKSNIRPEELDLLITTSCTGFMIPSFDAYVVDRLKLKGDIKRLPITELGCAGGVAGLMYANDILKSYEKQKAALITLELPSNTIQLEDYSWDNLISTALFSDGVTCSLLSTEKESLQLSFIHTGMVQVPESTDILQYNLTNTGLRMHLDKQVPQVIDDYFLQIVNSFLKKVGLRIDDIADFLIHPGGFKIIKNIQAILSRYKKDVSLSYDVMARYGNMSSSTIFFILKEYLSVPHAQGEYVLLLSFGPGFSAYLSLAQWQ